MPAAHVPFQRLATAAVAASLLLACGAPAVPAPPLPASEAASAPGLAAGYAFSEAAGATTADAGPNGITGTLSNATRTVGHSGGGLAFNGTSSYVDLGRPAALAPTGSMTASAWVYESANVGDDGIIVARSNGSGGWELKSSPDTGRRTFAFGVYTTTGGYVARYSNAARVLGTWYHVAGVYDAAARTLHVYVNGVLADGPLWGTVPAATRAAPVNAMIGRRTGGFHLRGTIDDVRFYGRALTPAEVLADVASPVEAPGGGTADLPPAVALTAPAAGALLSGAAVTVSATASDDRGVAGVQLLLDGAPLGAEDVTAPYAITWNTTTATSGGHVLSARARDTAGQTTLAASVAVTVDNQAPTGSVVVNGGAATTTQGAVTLSLAATDAQGAVTQLQLSNDGSTWSPAEPFTATRAWTLSAGAGTKTVYARFADAAGNWSVAASDTILLVTSDTTAPTTPAALTATAASTSRVNLAWAASTDDVGVVAYDVYRGGALVGAAAGTSYADTGLAPGTTYTYAVAARDAAGNVSGLSATATATTLPEIVGGAGVPTLVQHLSSTSNPIGKSEAGNHFRFTLPSPVLARNCLVLGVAFGATATLAAVPVTDTNGTWPTAPAAIQLDANRNVSLAIFVLPDAAPGVHTITVHFNSAILPVQYTVSEFSGIATLSPVSGSAGRSDVAAPAISSGTFTPANNDAGGGNLVWSLFWDDSNPQSGNEVVTFAAGPGFTLLDADIGWHDDSSPHHASQYAVQPVAAAITPSMTATMSPGNDRFIGLSVALRAAQAGTLPSGMRVVRIVHFTNQTLSPGPFTLQVPSSGNLLVLVTHEDNVITINGVTDSAGNAWTMIQPENDEPQFWVAGSATTRSDLKLTLAIGGTPQPASFTVYDIAGAAAAPIGASAGAPSRDLTNLTVANDFPALTPSTPNGIAIAACVLGQGPSTGFAAGAPPGAIFDYVNYAGQTDGSTMNNSDCRGHVTTNSTATLRWNWVITANPNNSGSATALHLRAP